MRVKLTAKHPRPTSPSRAPVRPGSPSARKPVRPAPLERQTAAANKPAASKTRGPRTAANEPHKRAGERAESGQHKAGKAPARGSGETAKRGAAPLGADPRRPPSDTAAKKPSAASMRGKPAYAATEARTTGRRAAGAPGAGKTRAATGERPAPRAGSERNARPRSDMKPASAAATGERVPGRGAQRTGESRTQQGSARTGSSDKRGARAVAESGLARRGTTTESQKYGERRKTSRTDAAAGAADRPLDRPLGRRSARSPDEDSRRSGPARKAGMPVKGRPSAEPAREARHGRSGTAHAAGERPARHARPPAARPPRSDETTAPRQTRPAHAESRAGRAAADTEADGTVRLAKRMSELGLCSRREADEWIENGWVRVDGVRVDTLGARVKPDQHIEVTRDAQAAQARQVTILLNKPVGYVSGQAEDGYEPAVTLITPANRWDGDRAPQRFTAAHLRTLAPAGRLDIDSTGLLVLTQDGRIAKQLIGEHSAIEKEYLVRVAYGERTTDIDRHFPAEKLALLRYGLSLDGATLKPAKVSWQNSEQLRFVLREGKKRQIRRMCELVGLHVVGLKRVRMGRITLGALPQGKWRYLLPYEAF